MIAEYVQKGETLDYLNNTEETITAGSVVMLGELCTVAATNISAGEVGTVATVGVWTMPKDESDITAGAKLYYDAESDKLTITADSNVFVGIAACAAGTSASTVNVRLNG